MFVGAINQNCRKFFRTYSECFNGRKCAVGCSGNFTFEQLISRYSTPIKLTSNDVSLYTCALGRWLTGSPADLSLSEDWQWLAPSFEDPDSQVATIVQLLPFLQFDPDKGDYHRRMHQHYRANWAQYHAATKANLLAAKDTLRVDEFWPEDVFDFYRRQDGPDTVFLSFMPTYKGGYERLYKKLAEAISWTQPQYPLLDDQRRADIYDFLTARDYVIYDDRPLDLPLVFVERRGGAGRDVFMYSNLALPPALVKKYRAIAKPKYKFIGPDDEISAKSRIDWLVVKNEVVNYYREMFLAKNIAFVDGQLPLLFFVDGKLFGFAIFTLSKFGGAKEGCIYVLSDFVAPYSRYKRLSKLLLLILTTKQVQQVIAEKFWMRVKALHTTAFTKKPVSAKYRGVFVLEKRAEDHINYKAEAGTRTIKGALKEWTTRYSKL
ncbi:putative antirestriction adenine methyltransferase [Desulfarculus baarsii]